MTLDMGGLSSMCRENAGTVVAASGFNKFGASEVRALVALEEVDEDVAPEADGCNCEETEA